MAKALPSAADGKEKKTLPTAADGKEEKNFAYIDGRQRLAVNHLTE